MTSALRVENISFRYNGDFTLKSASLTVEKGSFAAIAGPSGSGKTTLLKILAGFHKPGTGSVAIDGQPLTGMPRRKMAALCAFLPPELDSAYNYTVREIALMGRFARLKWWQDYTLSDRDETDRVLTLLGLETLSNRNVNSLSSGEKQKAFIAQCVCQRPSVLLLDEPTAHLDPASQAALVETLRGLRLSENIAVLAVSHDINLMARAADAIYFMRGGELSGGGTPSEEITARKVSAIYGKPASVGPGPDGKPCAFF